MVGNVKFFLFAFCFLFLLPSTPQRYYVVKLAPPPFLRHSVKVLAVFFCLSYLWFGKEFCDVLFCEVSGIRVEKRKV
jgi:hypothetical protein